MSVPLPVVMLASVITAASAEFCSSHLFTDDVLCDDGSVLPPNGCCPDNNFCPRSCRRAAMSNGVCSCSGCAKRRAVELTLEEQFVKAHNYFRCRHGQNAVAGSSAVAANAGAAAQGSCDIGGLVHSKSYAATPPAGENLAMGQNSIESAVEAWYSEITTAAGGQGYIAGTSSGDSRYEGSGNVVGHYTALIWGSTSEIGCGTCNVGQTPVWACQYANQPSNFGGVNAFIANVPQSNDPIATEETCCDQVYGSAEGSPAALPSGNSTNPPTPLPAVNLISATLHQHGRIPPFSLQSIIACLIVGVGIGL